MSRELIIFIIITALTIGAILVYTKNHMDTTKPADTNVTTTTQELSNSGMRTLPDSSQQSAAVTPPAGNPTTAGAVNPSTPPVIENVTELKVTDIREGTGEPVKAGNTVEVNYLGTLLNGSKFDSSYDRGQTFSFNVGAGSVIEGWDKGLVGMKVGGKRRLAIPAELGYGSQGAGSIPPNSPLIFEIELISIK